MRNTLLATIAVAALALPAAANAALITSFAQESGSNTVTATDNGTTTNISIPAGTLVTLGGGLFNVSGASFELTAHSIDAATTIGSSIIQHYSGSFCVSSGTGCTGNFLSGTFTDAAFGANGGPGLTVNVNNPPEQLTLASNVIPASELQPPSSFNLTFVNVTPALHLDGSTIAAFTASFTGDVSASAAAAPEPASLATLGVGLLGLAGVTMIRRRR
jgi:MYXO-CTERM domain-containing protein